MAAFNEEEKKQFQNLNRQIAKEKDEEVVAFTQSSKEFDWNPDYEIDRILLKILFLAKKHVPGSAEQIDAIVKAGPSKDVGYLRTINEIDKILNTDELDSPAQEAMESLFSIRNFLIKNHKEFLPIKEPSNNIEMNGDDPVIVKINYEGDFTEAKKRWETTLEQQKPHLDLAVSYSKQDGKRRSLLANRKEILELRHLNAAKHEDAAKAGDGKVFVLSDYIDLTDPKVRGPIAEAAKRCGFPNPESEETAKNLVYMFLLSDSFTNAESIKAPWKTWSTDYLKGFTRRFLIAAGNLRLDVPSPAEEGYFKSTIANIAQWCSDGARKIKSFDQPLAGEMAKAYIFLTDRFQDRTVKHSENNYGAFDIGGLFRKGYGSASTPESDRRELKNLAEGKERDSFRMPEADIEEALRVIEGNEKYDLVAGMYIIDAGKENLDINEIKAVDARGFRRDFDSYLDPLRVADREWIENYKELIPFDEWNSIPSFLSRFLIDGKKADDILKEKADNYSYFTESEREDYSKILIVNALMNGKKVEFIPFAKTNDPKMPIGVSNEPVRIANVPDRLPSYTDDFRLGDYLNLNDPELKQALLSAGFAEGKITEEIIAPIFLMYLTGSEELGNDRITIHDLPKLNALSKEEKEALGRKFAEGVKAHPVEEKTAAERDAGLRWYAGFYKGAVDSLKESGVTIPAFKDLDTLGKVLYVRNSPFMAGAMVVRGLTECMPYAWESNAFVSKYGPAEYMHDKLVLNTTVDLAKRVDELAEHKTAAEEIKGIDYLRWNEGTTFKTLGNDLDFEKTNLQRAAMIERSDPDYKDNPKEFEADRTRRHNYMSVQIHEETVKAFVRDINAEEPKEIYELSFIPKVPPFTPFDPKAVSEEELRKSEAIFDTVHARLLAEEGIFLKETNESFTDGFQMEDEQGNVIKTNAEVDRLLKENGIQADNPTAYQKAFILHQMANPDTTLTYNAFVYNPERGSYIADNLKMLKRGISCSYDYVRSNEVIAEEQRIAEEEKAKNRELQEQRRELKKQEKEKDEQIKLNLSEMKEFADNVDLVPVFSANLEIAKPEFIVYGDEEKLSEEELAKTEKVFDTIFAPVAGKEWFDLSGFEGTAPLRSDRAYNTVNLSPNPKTPRETQIGKAKILRAFLNPVAEPTYTIEKQKVELRPKQSEKAKEAEKAYKEKVNAEFQTAMAGVLELKELSMYENQTAAAEGGPEGAFEYQKLTAVDAYNLHKAAEEFDRLFAPVEDKLPDPSDKTWLFRRFTYNGQNVYELLTEELEGKSGVNVRDASKAFIMHNLAKNEKMGLTVGLFDTEKEGFWLKPQENVQYQTKYTRGQVLEERRQEEERILQEEEERIRVQEEAKRREQEAAEAKERERLEAQQKQLKEENDRVQEERHNNFETLNEESKKKINEFLDDFKNPKYTHRNLAPVTPDCMLDQFKAEDFLDLSTPEKKTAAENILKNAGIDTPEDPKVVSTLLVLYMLGEKGKSLDDLSALTPEEKKGIGTDFLKAFEEHPVTGTLAGSREKTEENLTWFGQMVGKANDVWIHKSGMEFPKREDLITPDKFRETMNGKFGLAYGLSANMPKILKNWNSRSSKPTEDNPYGIDRGQTFYKQYSNKKPLDNKNLLYIDRNTMLAVKATGEMFASLHHDDPSNPYQYRIKATKARIAVLRMPRNRIDSFAVGTNYETGHEQYKVFLDDFPDKTMEELDKLDEKTAEEIYKNDYNSSNAPENQKENAKQVNRASNSYWWNYHLLAGLGITEEIGEGLNAINESDHSEILNLAFNSEENIGKEPDYANLVKEENRKELDGYEEVFDRIFDPIRYYENHLGNEKAVNQGNAYRDFVVKFKIGGVSVKDMATKLTGIEDTADYGDLKLRNKVAKVIILHAMAKGDQKIEFSPSTMNSGHGGSDLDPVEVKPFTREMKREMDRVKAGILNPDLIQRENLENEQKNQPNQGEAGDEAELEEERIENILNEEEKDNEGEKKEEEKKEDKKEGEKKGKKEADKEEDEDENELFGWDDATGNTTEVKDTGKPKEKENNAGKGIINGNLAGGKAGKKEEKKSGPEERFDVKFGIIQAENLSDKEKCAVMVGRLEAWEKTMLDNFTTYKKLLSETQKNKLANFTAKGGEEGPGDYILLAESIRNCGRVFGNKNSTLSEKRRAFDHYHNMTLRYREYHREIFRSHRSAETAERYRIICSMSDLAEEHLKLFDFYRSQLAGTVKRTDQKYNAGNQSFANLLKKAETLPTSADGDKPLKYYRDGGFNGFEEERIRDEKKILYARYGRRTGLKTSNERNSLEVISGTGHSLTDYAKNYLDNKFLEAIENTNTAEKFIRVNERIREKAYPKEVKALADNWYFERIVQKNAGDNGWFDKWTEAERKSVVFASVLKNNVSVRTSPLALQGLGITIRQTASPAQSFEEYMKSKESDRKTDELNAHKILAEILLEEVLIMPKNKALLNAYSDSPENYRKALALDVARYIQNVEPLDFNRDDFDYVLKWYMKNSALLTGVSRRAKSFYQDVVFNAEDRMELKQEDARKDAGGAVKNGEVQQAGGNEQAKPAGGDVNQVGGNEQAKPDKGIGGPKM